MLACLSTREDYKDESCVLDVGDHPFIRHETIIDYGAVPDPLPAADIERGVVDGRFTPREPVSEAVLKRILQGAGGSQRIPNGRWLILNDQGLVD